MIPASPQISPHALDSARTIAMVLAVTTVMFWRKILKALILAASTILIALIAFGLIGFLQTMAQHKIG